ncbi:hypothetical protein E4T44_02216 [Aureobasidium sp. EXF-8845]|nr:hypothetical protein E4T44_02216 [Aureobasidium sp. EXF-8845]KAI4856574.1 hypothetical protein E4T45_01958 [Aureobasidium sp. EXF-8846]
MFSGCRDEETSADAQINGVSEGAMSWAFLEAMKSHGDPTYKEALHLTRALLKASEYTQVLHVIPLLLSTLTDRRKVPQLCVGCEMDSDQRLII